MSKPKVKPRLERHDGVTRSQRRAHTKNARRNRSK